MKNVKKLFILFKKDLFILKSYVISFLFLYILSAIFLLMIFYISEKTISEEDMFYYEFVLFLVAFGLSISWAGYMPLRSITH